MKRVKPFNFHDFSNLKWYFPDEYKFYGLILMILSTGGVNLIKLNCLLVLAIKCGLLNDTKYETMDMIEIFFQLKIALLNLGTPEVVKTLTEDDWDSYVLKFLKSEKAVELIKQQTEKITSLERLL